MQRVGAQQEPDGRGGRGERQGCDEQGGCRRAVRAVLPDRAGQEAELLGRSGEVRAEHRTDRRRPDHDRQVGRPACGPGQVGRGEARGESRRGARAEQQHAGEQQRPRLEQGRGRCEGRSEEGDDVAGRERPPSAVALGEARERERDDRGPHDGRGLREAGDRVGARELGRDERAHRDAGRDPDPAEDLARREDRDGPSLDAVDGDVGRGAGRCTRRGPGGEVVGSGDALRSHPGSVSAPSPSLSCQNHTGVSPGSLLTPDPCCQNHTGVSPGSLLTTNCFERPDRSVRARGSAGAGSLTPAPAPPAPPPPPTSPAPSAQHRRAPAAPTAPPPGRPGSPRSSTRSARTRRAGRGGPRPRSARP
ncbi:hypothetical protein OJAG_05500 [Oerskovia enterophila]|uniref:Uncharacterized protein n=1 Tax=Oerskovia enterophila TaxID=43678 RepID=A0A163SUM9_9CELL|nr:hypothetical protein OJAG_05500 [Oerskovia enterophila]